MKQQFFTISQAARHKGVSRTAIYDAIKAQRLKAVEVMGKPAIGELELKAWKPQAGQKAGQPRSKEVKARIAASQKARWARLKQAQSNTPTASRATIKQDDNQAGDNNE